MSDGDDKWLPFHYDNLLADAVIHLGDYIESNGLDDLKSRFRSTLQPGARKSIKSPEDLLEKLEAIGKLGLQDIEILKYLAQELNLTGLEDKVYEYELHRSGRLWGTIIGGAQSTVIGLKSVLQTKEGKVVIAGAVVIGLIHKKPEILELLQNVLPVALQIIGVNEGSICFMIETSCLSSLRQLWESYVDGSLREKLEEVFNGIPEVKELSNGEDIHVEVMLDEYDYHNALWELVVSQVKDNSVQQESKASLGRRRRHSFSCDDDLPAGDDKIYLTCQEWMEWKEMANQLVNETRKRKQTEDQLEEQQQEHKKKIQKLEEQVNEVDKNNMELRQEVTQLKTDLQTSENIIEKCLKPLEHCEPREMLSKLSEDLLSKLPVSVELLEKLLSFITTQILENSEERVDVLLQVMQQHTEVFSKMSWHCLDKDVKARLTSRIESRMTSVIEQLLKHPNVNLDVLLQVMQQHVELLSKLNLYGLHKDFEGKLASNIESRMALVFQQLLKHPNVNHDVLLQVMQQHIELLSKLNLYGLHKDVQVKLASNIESRMALVFQQWVKDHQVGSNELLQVMQQHMKMLCKLDYSSLDRNLQVTLVSGMESRMALVFQQWELVANDFPVNSNMLLQVVQQYINMLHKLNWSSLGEEVRARLASGIHNIMNVLIQQLSKDPQAPDIHDVIKLSSQILQKVSWSDFQEDLKIKVLSCLGLSMDTLSQRLPKSDHRPEFLNDVVCLVLEMSSQLPSSSEVTSLVQCHLKTLMATLKQTLSRSAPHHSMWKISVMVSDICRKLPEKAMSPEVVVMLLSIVNSLVSRSEYRSHGFHHEKLEYMTARMFRDISQVFKNKLPSSLPATNDVLIQLLSLMENMPETEMYDMYDIMDFIRRIEPKLLVDLKELKVQVEKHISDFDVVFCGLKAIHSEESQTLVDPVHVLQQQEQNLEGMKNAVLKLKLKLEEMIATSQMKPATRPPSTSLGHSEKFLPTSLLTTLEPSHPKTKTLFSRKPATRPPSTSLGHASLAYSKFKPITTLEHSGISKRLPPVSKQTLCQEEHEQEKEMKSKPTKPEATEETKTGSTVNT